MIDYQVIKYQVIDYQVIDYQVIKYQVIDYQFIDQQVFIKGCILVSNIIEGATTHNLFRPLNTSSELHVTL